MMTLWGIWSVFEIGGNWIWTILRSWFQLIDNVCDIGGCDGYGDNVGDSDGDAGDDNDGYGDDGEWRWQW